VDEYDKPILDALEKPDVARDNRDTLCGFYSVIKDSDAHICFAFLIGVSKFSKVSLFSGLNNLQDITLDERYSTICGYTDTDVDTVFAPNWKGWTGRKSAAGTTATTGWARASTTPSTCCFCSASANSGRTGSKPARPRFWSSCWPAEAITPRIWPKPAAT